MDTFLDSCLGNLRKDMDWEQVGEVTAFAVAAANTAVYERSRAVDGMPRFLSGNVPLFHQPLHHGVIPGNSGDPSIPSYHISPAVAHVVHQRLPVPQHGTACCCVPMALPVR